MEIKTTKEIINNELGVILNSVDYDVNHTLFEINKNKKWIAQEEIIKELDKTWNMINKYKMDRHPNYISKTQVAIFLRGLMNAITSDKSKMIYPNRLKPTSHNLNIKRN